jgi:hypothetical protein
MKTDVTHSYRQLKPHRRETCVSIVHWKGALYLYNALPFGVAPAASYYTRLSNSMVWALRKEFKELKLDATIISIMDDSLVLATEQHGTLARSAVLERHDRWLLPINQTKLEIEGTLGSSFIYGGLEVLIGDNGVDILRLGDKRKKKILLRLTDALEAESGQITAEQALSLGGHIFGAVRAVKAGGIYTVGIRDVYRQVHEAQAIARESKRPKSWRHKLIKVEGRLRIELTKWRELCTADVGNKVFTSKVEARTVVSVVADASFKGMGGSVVLTDGNGMQHVHVWSIMFKPHELAMMRAFGIHHLELFALANTLIKYAPLLRGAIVRLLSDNASTVACAGNAKARKEATADILARMFDVASEHEICVARVDHIEGETNTVCDWASREGAAATYMLIKLANSNVNVHAIQVGDDDDDKQWLLQLVRRVVGDKHQ